ncbi:MAG: hypothetical protein U0822_26980 [Anaerolineae bacterium]
MRDMLDLIFTHATSPTDDRYLREQIAAQVKAVNATAGKGDRGQVEQAEKVVQADPAHAFEFDATGLASLTAAGSTWSAGRFETVSIRELRERARLRTAGATGRVRLCVLNGASPVTDIGSLQATSRDGALFQVASQFNCLESPGPYVTPVAEYFNDPTQGPRAAISAFPGTLLRHYAAPSPGGARFVQETDRRQIDLLADALGLDVVRNGYFTGEEVADRHSLGALLESNFEAIRVGVHDELQVVLGYDWDGGLEASERSRIAQVFTSTVAGGEYGAARLLGRETFAAVCRQMLRAAYLGTLLAAISLGRRRVVLTLIGGGAFNNPKPLIWTAIEWALEEVAPFLAGDLEVVVNGHNLPLTMRYAVLAAVKRYNGAYVTFTRSGLDTIQR